MIKLGIFGDNGSSGSFCIMDLDSGRIIDYFHTPTIKSQDYTKKAKMVSRLDWKKFNERISKSFFGPDFFPIGHVELCVIERPFITNFRFKNSIIAARCFEATLICFEHFGIKPIIVDSKEWQSCLLKGKKGKEELKKASDKWCKDFYPHICLNKKGKKGQDIKTDPGMGDSILIASWARSNWLANK